MPDKKGKESEEEVSEDLEGKKTPEESDEETAEDEKTDSEKEADELLGKTVKVGNREMKVSQLMKDHEGLQAEYTKGQQLMKDPERLKAYLKSEFDVDLSEEKKESSSEDEPSDEIKDAIAGGKEAGFVHKDDLAERDKLLIERTKMEIYLENLEKPKNLGEYFPDIDPNDLPEFSKFDIVQYMTEEGFKDPVKAYRDKYDTELKALEKKANTGDKTTFTEKPTSGGVKLPPGKSPGKMTEEESAKAMASMLEGKKA
jgi:hypothetical protein